MTTIQKIKAEIIEMIQNIHDEEILNKIKEYVYEITNYSKEEQTLTEKVQEGVPNDK